MYHIADDTRADEEDVKIAEPALDLMATMASQTSLRYALNLIAPSHLLALRRKSPIVDIPDIKNAYQYFSDAIRSTAYAKEMAGMMFGEEEEEDVRASGGGMMVDPVA